MELLDFFEEWHGL